MTMAWPSCFGEDREKQQTVTLSQPPTSTVTFDFTHEWQCRHERYRPNNTFLLFHLYKDGSVLSVLGSVWPHDRLCSRLSRTSSTTAPWTRQSTDQINRTSLFEVFLMMCRSTSDLSLLVWMQFFPNYRITLTCHLPSSWRHGQGKKMSR